MQPWYVVPPWFLTQNVQRRLVDHLRRALPRELGLSGLDEALCLLFILKSDLRRSDFISRRVSQKSGFRMPLCTGALGFSVHAHAPLNVNPIGLWSE